MLLFTNCTLLLTDEEFSGFLTEINQIAVKYMKKEAVEGSKTRQITLISSPSNEQVMIMENKINITRFKEGSYKNGIPWLKVNGTWKR